MYLQAWLDICLPSSIDSGIRVSDRIYESRPLRQNSALRLYIAGISLDCKPVTLPQGTLLDRVKYQPIAWL